MSVELYKKVITAIDSKGKERNFVALSNGTKKEKSFLRIIIDGFELMVDEKGCFKHPKTHELFTLKAV